MESNINPNIVTAFITSLKNRFIVGSTLCFILILSSGSLAADLIWKKLPDMPVEKWEAGTALLDDKLYLFGGYTKGVKSSKISNVFNPKNNSWNAGPPYPKGHSRTEGGTFLNDGTIYTTGGHTTAVGSKKISTLIFSH